MRKVLVFKSALLPYSETFIRDQVLSYERWQAVLVGTHRVTGLPLEELRTVLLRSPLPQALDRACWTLLRELRLAHPLATARLRREEASLLHAHFGTEAVVVWPLARRLRLPLIVTLHGSDINIDRAWWEAGFPPLGARLYPRRLLALAAHPTTHFVAISGAIRERAIAYGITPERISIRPIGIDLRRFRPGGVALAARRRRILFVARLVEKKGAEYLIRALPRVLARVPDAELVIVGDGPLERALQGLATRLRVPVEFAGRATSAQVKEHLDQARVCCVPSITASNGDAEGLAMTVLEAQACGVPVVTSARGATTEGILEGKTGFAFPEKDLEQLTDRLTRVLSDDGLADSMSTAATRFVTAKFDIRHCTRALEDLYDTFLENSARMARCSSKAS
jgi:glycosyltransferase involved in cell wall biosynthesis